ncbi:snake venom 5'-nucleotidase-like [Gigantopelta aegis]|uniref:snake venom 5'-nucleotidase-like n=1 Tax=Gigantopelta aegis TaxID=1735272 RepID=UPI001B88A005|nr:snake venom 5'-nucleotidase-like [Gigantopelta aegis]
MMGVALLFSITFTVTCIFAFCFSFNLTIMHTNDVHDRFEETSKYSGKCRPKDKLAEKCFGGTARMKTEIKKIRSMYPNSILLDAGDQYSGTLWFYKYGGNVTATFMNYLGYDVMAIGNHEFDRRVEGLVPFLEGANFSVVSSNIDATKEPRLRGLFSARHIVSVGGELIGIIGYTTTETQYISQPGPTLTFKPEIDSIRAEVAALEAEGVNKIIALGHAGFSVDKEIARNVRGIDIVVGGHSNTFLYNGDAPSNEKPVGKYPHVVTQADGSRVLCVQDYAYSKYLGFLQVHFDDNGVVTSWSGNPILLDKTVKQDADTLAKLEPYRQGVVNETDQIIGRTQVFLEGRRTVCRITECNIGNLVTDGMLHQNLKHPDSTEWNHVSIAVMNAGGIRSSVQQGDISVGDVLSVLPFRNTVDIIELKGIHVLGMFENSVARYSKDADRLFGGFLQVSGIRVTYDIAKPVGKRVVKVKVRCSNCSIPKYEDLDPDTVYKIIMPSFIADGNDFYSVIRENKIKHHLLGDVDSDVLVEYIKQRTPIISGLEDRITILDGTQVCVKWSTVAGSAGMPPFSFALYLFSIFVFLIRES